MKDGSGLGALIPPLAQSDYLKNSRNELPCIIRYGIEGEITVNGQKYNQPMAGIAKLSDVDIVNIINYICVSWGNDYPIMSLPEVRSVLQECEANDY